MRFTITYSPRGPGYATEFVQEFDHDPSPQEIARGFGFTEGSVHYERIIDGSFTVATVDTRPTNIRGGHGARSVGLVWRGSAGEGPWTRRGFRLLLDPQPDWSLSIELVR